MPEAVGSDTKACEIAASKVTQRLRQLGVDHRALTRTELGYYPGGEFVTGWRANVDIAGTIVGLNLLVPTGFPWQPPRVALANPPVPGAWPHVECDGRLCLAPNTLSVNPDDPAGVSISMLADACELIASFRNGDLKDDFGAEVLSYWALRATHARPAIVSLVQPQPSSRRIRVWRGTSRYVLAEDDDTIAAWLTNLSGERPTDFSTEEAALIWVGDPLIPSEYPENGADLARITRRVGSDADCLLRDIAVGIPDRLVTLLGFQTKNGSALTATVFSKGPAPAHGARDPLTKGFRAGAVPTHILLPRYFGGGTLARASVERADAAWIHGRGRDARQPRLRGATVIIIGCGSLGGPLAVMLAQAGIGRIVLVDKDTLSWANTGRHPLGASRVGEGKAKGLAEKLRADFPHLTIEYLECDADTLLRWHGELLDDSDLIIAATGNWSAETQLDAWHAGTGRSASIIYTWTEAHACAGHAALISKRGCLRCGFNETGVPNLTVTEWPAGQTHEREPACGAVFQPYGPVELGFTINVAAELALDVLVGNDVSMPHRIWIGSLRRLREAGGVWSAAWRSDQQFRSEGNFVLERPWPAACENCAGKAAA